MLHLPKLKLVNFFLKVTKNVKISWRTELRKNKSFNTSYVKLGDTALFLEIFNLVGGDHIAVIHSGILSSTADFEPLLKELLEIDDLRITHFKFCPELSYEASEQLKYLFPLEYATLTAFAPLIIVRTASEASWLLVVNWALNKEPKQHKSDVMGNTTLLIMVRNCNTLIDIRNGKNSEQFRLLFRNCKEKKQLHFIILRMLGAKLADSLNWIRRLFF